MLRSGSSGTLKIAEVKKDVLQVPQIAINELQDKTFVYILDQNNKAQRRNIQISGKSKNNYIVDSGLKENDRVITSGFDKLTDGSPVAPILQK
jgi:membrane fusion protein (multidrug efflux system)